MPSSVSLTVRTEGPGRSAAIATDVLKRIAALATKQDAIFSVPVMVIHDLTCDVLWS